MYVDKGTSVGGSRRTDDRAVIIPPFVDGSAIRKILAFLQDDFGRSSYDELRDLERRSLLVLCLWAVGLFVQLKEPTREQEFKKRGSDSCIICSFDEPKLQEVFDQSLHLFLEFHLADIELFEEHLLDSTWSRLLLGVPRSEQRYG